MHPCTGYESSLGCGVLSHRVAGSSLQRVSRAMRSAGLGAALSLAAMITAVGCSGDSTADPGAGSGGSTGTGGSGGAGGGPGGGGNVDSSTDCAVRTDVDQYSANMTKKGSNGLMSFLLIQSDPAPPALGDNVWKLKVTGSDGMPLTQGLTITLEMVEHGHASPKTPKITYDPATGTYGLDPVYLSMGGKWTITVSITDPSDSAIVIDKAVFFFCVA